MHTYIYIYIYIHTGPHLGAAAEEASAACGIERGQPRASESDGSRETSTDPGITPRRTPTHFPAQDMFVRRILKNMCSNDRGSFKQRYLGWKAGWSRFIGCLDQVCSKRGGVFRSHQGVQSGTANYGMDVQSQNKSRAAGQRLSSTVILQNTPK